MIYQVWGQWGGRGGAGWDVVWHNDGLSLQPQPRQPGLGLQRSGSSRRTPRGSWGSWRTAEPESRFLGEDILDDQLHLPSFTLPRVTQSRWEHLQRSLLFPKRKPICQLRKVVSTNTHVVRYSSFKSARRLSDQNMIGGFLLTHQNLVISIN